MAFRFFIILVWLSVPAAAYIFASQSYDKYQLEERQQLGILDSWEAYLRVHTATLAQKSTEVTHVKVSDRRRTWKNEWNELVSAREQEKAKLPRAQASHYPRTQLELLELDGELDDLQENIERAELFWFDSLRLREGIEEIVSQMDSARASIRYYEQIRAYGIEALLLEDLKLMQQAYDKRRLDLRRAEQEASSRLSAVRRQSRSMLDRLDSLSDLKRADAEDSYQSDLGRRLAEFDLTRELKELATGEPVDGSPDGQGKV